MLKYRWLSLLPGIERLISTWPAVKIYFLKLGQEECPRFIWEFIKDQEHQLNGDDELSFSDCFIYFMHSYMIIFQQFIKKLEDNKIQSRKVYSIRFKLRLNLNDRLADNFYGYKVNQSLPKLPQWEQIKFRAEAKRVLERIISYLGKWFNYEDSIFESLQLFDLCRPNLTFDALNKVASIINVSVDGDELYNEFCILREWKLR